MPSIRGNVLNREYLTKAEFKMFLREHNGSLKRIEDNQGELKGLIATQNDQLASLLEKGSERIDKLEDFADDMLGRKKLVTWLWRGFVAALGITLTVMSILVVIHVL